MRARSFVVFLTALVATTLTAGNIQIYPAPDGMPVSRKFKVKVQGKEVPVYEARIGHEDRKIRETDNHEIIDFLYDICGIASFDLLSGSANVEVEVNEPVNNVKILPTSAGVNHRVVNGKIKFKVDRPQQLTVEVNGDYVRSLHIFVNPRMQDKPNPDDPNVIYFGPGMHDLTKDIIVSDGQTLYIDGGAVLRPYQGSITIKGNHTRVCGHGIIDCNVRDMKHRITPIRVEGKNTKLEGFTIIDANSWTVVLSSTRQVAVDNIKLLSYRPNSDGIDICNTWDVSIRNCFFRTFDDLVVIKSFGKGDQGTRNVLVEKCVLWNELAHALSLGAEMRNPVENIVFRNCDLIRDHGREWALRVFHCDDALIKNVTFENIRIEECIRFASLWINDNYWSTCNVRGKIQNITFKDITVDKAPIWDVGVEFLGFDKDHAIRHVAIDNVSIAGKKLTRENIKANEFVYDIEVK